MHAHHWHLEVGRGDAGVEEGGVGSNSLQRRGPVVHEVGVPEKHDFIRAVSEDQLALMVAPDLALLSLDGVTRRGRGTTHDAGAVLRPEAGDVDQLLDRARFYHGIANVRGDPACVCMGVRVGKARRRRHQNPSRPSKVQCLGAVQISSGEPEPGMVPDVLRDLCVVSTDTDDSWRGLMREKCADGGTAGLRRGWEDRELHVWGGIDQI